jgi:hypothetical protein
VRLPEGSALRSAHPLFIVKKVNSALPLGKGVETASFVRTGVALMPKPGTSAEDLLQDKDKISKALGDGKVEGDEKWVVVKVHDLSTRMTTIDDAHQLGYRDVSIEQDVFPEVAEAFGTAPESGLWTRRQEGSATASVRLTFRAENMKDTPRTVVVMGSRLKVEYPATRGVRPPLCKKCWGLHRTEVCKDAPRCRQCGDTEHQSAAHPQEVESKCVNCGGQHAADSSLCPKAAPAPRRAPKTHRPANKC